MTENTVVAMGIAYAKRGWPVFPVDSKTKVPLIKDWPNRATTKPELIRRIWEKVPNAGIGIVTGSGLVVVDLDVKDGKDGPGNWDSYLEDRGITLPETLRAQTRSGGQHRYYQVPDGAEYFNSTGMIAGTIVEGVDIRGTGGFVVAPPTPGYEFLTEFDGAVLPELPVGVLPERVPVATTEPRRRHTSAEALTDFSGGLASLKVATEGERNATLYKVAVQAAEFISDGLLDKEAADFELGFAAMECGLDPDEIAQTVGSAFSKIEREAAPEPSILLSGPWGRETLWADDLLWAEDNMQPPIWGPEESPLWMPGESLMIVGESGIGKSTLAQSLVAARIGLLPDVLGWPVADDGGRVLYLSLDRPAQIRRMLRRLVPDEKQARQGARDRLVIKEGPLPVLLTDERYFDWLRNQAQAAGATTVIIDSLKNVILKPSEEGLANAYDRTRQSIVGAGISLIEIHHVRKTTPDGHGGQGGLNDVHGSGFLTAGAGSVLKLFRPRGAASDSNEVWLQQDKSLAGTFKGMALTRDGETGLFSQAEEAETMASKITGALLFGDRPMTVAEVCTALFSEGATPTEVERVKKALARMTKESKIQRAGRGLYSL